MSERLSEGRPLSPSVARFVRVAGVLGVVLALTLAMVSVGFAQETDGARGVIPPPCLAQVNNGPTTYTTVQDAVDAASDGDLVKVAGGCAGVEARDAITQTVIVTKSLTIQGGYSSDFATFDPVANPTTLDAQDQGRVLVIGSPITPTTPATVTVENLMLMGGNAVAGGTVIADSPDDAYAGGVYVSPDNVLDLSDSTVRDSHAGNSGGGGIGNDGTLTLDNVLVAENFTDEGAEFGFGGGISNFSLLVVTDSQIVSNTAGDITDTLGFPFGNNGGGIANAETMTLTGSTIQDNRAGNLTDTLTDSLSFAGSGGGLYNLGSATVQTSIIQKNRAGDNLTEIDFVCCMPFGGPPAREMWLETFRQWGEGAARPTAPLSGYTALGMAGRGRWARGAMPARSTENAPHRGPGFSLPFAGDGGGLANGAFLTMTNSLVLSNTAGSGFFTGLGGGISNAPALFFATPASVLLQDSLVTENGAGAGGGIFNGDLFLGESVQFVGENVRVETNFTFDGEPGADGDATEITGTDGFPGGSGGGILNLEEMTLTDSVVAGNRTGDGGAGGDGAANTAGPGGNGGVSGDGGGLFNNATLTLSNTQVLGNRTGAGGAGGVSGGDATPGGFGAGGASGGGAGVANRSSEPQEWSGLLVSQNTIGSGGSATNGLGGSSGNGAGLLHDGAALTVTQSAIVSNTVGAGAESLFNASGDGGAGGGVYISPSGTLTLHNSTVSGNVAGAGGPGISNGGSGGGLAVLGTVTVESSTIVSNTAGSRGSSGGAQSGMQGDGGGVVVIAISDTITGTLTFNNTIVANNAVAEGGLVPKTGFGPDCRGTLISVGYNLVENLEGCTIRGSTAADIFGQDPLVGPLADNGGSTPTHALLPGSPAVDVDLDLDAELAVANGLPPRNCPAVDQRGLGRPKDGDGDGTALCDIGSFEAQLPGPTAVTIDGLTTNRDAGLWLPAALLGLMALVGLAARRRRTVQF